MSINTLQRAITQPLYKRDLSVQEAAMNYNCGLPKALYALFINLFGEDTANEWFPQMRTKVESVEALINALDMAESLQKHSLHDIQVLNFYFEGEQYFLKDNEKGIGFHLARVVDPDRVLFNVNGHHIKDLVKRQWLVL